MESLLTPDDVAKLLQVSLRTVYANGKRLGGFYPAGIKVLRFREEVIREFMEGQGERNVEIHLPGQREGLRRGRTPDQSGSQDGPGREEIRRALFFSLPRIGPNFEELRKDPYDLLGDGRRLSPDKRKKTRQQDV